jgi:hypothetical protein
MGLFDFFSKATPESIVAKNAPRIASKRTQAPDRWDAIHAVGKLKTPAAVEALLPRFTFFVEPSITDNEEKDEAFRYIVETGAAAIEPTVKFMARAETLSWPMRILDRVADGERVVGELIKLLEPMGTEYERDPQRKLQLLSALEERKDPRIASAVVRFVGDANDAARFHAIGAILHQSNVEDVRAELAAHLSTKEESVRIKTRLLAAFAERGWAVGEDAKAALTKAMPAGYTLDAEGVPKAR